MSPRTSNCSRNEKLLGKRLFFDTNLSEPAGLSCQSCHNENTAFAGNNGSTAGVPIGAAPRFWACATHRARCTLAGQASRPFVSDLEMNNRDIASVVAKVSQSSYAGIFRQEWGQDIFSRPDAAFAAITQSIQAFENTERFHPFSSKYDDYVKGTVQLSAQEARGLALFMNPEKGNCVACHVADPTSKDPHDSLFTDFTYDNFGVPRNMAIPSNSDPMFFDLGLCGPKRAPPSDDPSLCGAFKVPSLRNVARKQAFMHNGFFKNLRDVVAFYVTRDTDPGRWYTTGVKFDDLPPHIAATSIPLRCRTTVGPATRRHSTTPRSTTLSPFCSR